MSLALPPEFERAVRERVESGAYASAEEVFQAAFAALEDAEMADAVNDGLRAAIDVGLAELDRGDGIPGDVAMAEIRAEVREFSSGQPHGTPEPGVETRLVIPAQIEDAVLERVESGAYASPEQVFDACFNALPAWEIDQQAKLEALRRDIDYATEQLRRGEGSPLDEAFARIRARFMIPNPRIQLMRPYHILHP